MDEKRLNISELRKRLADKTGKKYWRSFNEIAETEEFREFLEQEFPSGAAYLDDPTGVTRRTFLKIMGASMAPAGLAACTATNPEKIVPYVEAPEEIVPGDFVMIDQFIDRISRVVRSTQTHRIVIDLL
jgi:molybdopterin-containing oxidoreductase family iron-sulfur binding subunit